MPHTAVTIVYADMPFTVVVVIKYDDIALFELTGIVGYAIIAGVGTKAINAPLAIIVLLLEERRIVRPGFCDPVYTAIGNISALVIGHGFTTGIDVGADFTACPTVSVDCSVTGRIAFGRLQRRVPVY